jgi:hypothetical protein
VVRVTLAVVLLGLCIVGCGSEAAKSTPTPAKTAAKGSVPAALVGHYSMRLGREHRGADARKELADGSARWRLAIAGSGGPGGGPAFTISNASLGPLESSAVEVKGDRVLLHKEECAASGPVESEYRYTSSGNKLTFTPVKNGCADKVAQTLLTASPWVKQG